MSYTISFLFFREGISSTKRGAGGYRKEEEAEVDWRRIGGCVVVWMRCCWASGRIVWSPCDRLRPATPDQRGRKQNLDEL